MATSRDIIVEIYNPLYGWMFISNIPTTTQSFINDSLVWSNPLLSVDWVGDIEERDFPEDLPNYTKNQIGGSYNFIKLVLSFEEFKAGVEHGFKNYGLAGGTLFPELFSVISMIETLNKYKIPSRIIILMDGT